MNVLFARATDSSSSDTSSLWTQSKESYHEQPSDEDYSDQNVSSIQYKPKLSVQHDEALKQRQIKWILVSLIEKLCSIYGESNEETRKIFMKTCQTLSALGFIDSEFIDEVAGVRTTYYTMFEQLLYTAMDSVRGRYKIMSFIERQKMMNEQFQSFTDNLDGKPKETSPYNYTTSSSEMIFNSHFQNSRYYNDFFQISLLGRGNLSSVWKAQNRLDDIEYAIKKVKMSEDDPYAAIFQEIKTWASLEHPYVIRYYSSWLEYSTTRDAEEEEEKRCQKKQGVDAASCGNTGDATSADSNHHSGMKKNNLVLYIQMQLCPSTLHDYIRCRNQHYFIDHERNIEIFRKILEGAAYIHQQGLVHRDLKPSNIFLNRPNDDTGCLCKEENWSPKIGDFGFTAEAVDLLSGEDNGRANVKNHNMAGTRTYAAPEQLVTPTQPFNQQTDIYSLGIILFELYYCSPNRDQAIEALKQGIFPDDFATEDPFIKDLILQMMHPDPSQRPSADELLNHEIYTKQKQEEEMDFLMDQYLKMKEEKELLEQRMLEMEREMEMEENVEFHQQPVTISTASEFVLS